MSKMSLLRYIINISGKQMAFSRNPVINMCGIYTEFIQAKRNLYKCSRVAITWRRKNRQHLLKCVY